MNVILIAIDTLRADRLGCYGYGRETSPAMDRLAAEGALFENFWAPCIPTHPGFTSIFTGVHGVTHGVVAQNRKTDALSEGLKTLPEILRGKKGLTTAAIDNLAQSHPWFFAGYDHYIVSRSKTAEWITGAALKWLGAYGRDPFFLFLHPWDPHSPYVVPPEYRNRFHPGDGKGGDPRHWDAIKSQLVYPFFKNFLYERMGGPTDLDYIAAQYDAEIRYCDDWLGHFFDALKTMGLWDDTAIIVTADHGESMTEHHVYFEHHGIYDCVLHVPLIARVPGVAKPGARSGELFQHIDIAPTICDLLGVAPHPQFEGRSLLPAIRGEAQQGYDAIYACEASRMYSWAVRTREWKFRKILDPGQYHVDYDELYRVADDPNESRNATAEHRDVADRLELQLSRWLDARLKGRPDPVRRILAEGSPMEKNKLEGLKALDMTFDNWIRDYQRRFDPQAPLR